MAKDPEEFGEGQAEEITSVIFEEFSDDQDALAALEAAMSHLSVSIDGVKDDIKRKAGQ